MSSEEEDLHSPDEPVIPVITTPVTTMLVTMVPVTTVPVATVHTTTLALTVYLPLSLGLQGAEGGVQGRRRDASRGFKWSTFDTTTQESWLLTLAPMHKSWCKYKPPHEIGTCPQCREEKEGWEVRLAHMESAQNRLIQVVDEALLGAWVQEAADAEARIQMVKIDALTPNPQAGGMGGMMGPKMKTNIRDLRMK
ncbi:UNVERIFIED_CONTAM: hypothetical protein K2H54_059493 [Gekko kuhli]